MRKKFLSTMLSLVGATALTVSVSACTSGSSFPEETVQGYFSALSTSTPDEHAAGLQFAAPNSIAAMYLTEQTAHLQAQQDGGTLSAETQEVVIKDDSVYVCYDGYDAEDADIDDYCSEYSNLVFDENGKLVSFDAGGKPLEGRIALGDGTPIEVADIANVTYLSSYVTIGGDLVVVVEIESNTDPLNIISFDATYVATNGRASSSKMSDGPSELKAGRLGNLAVWFPNVGLGGTLELKFLDSEYNDYSVEIPTSQ